MSTTPNMNLTLPIVSQTTGPTWANQINADLSVIDSHNHAPGAGAPIPSAALNINADVGFGTYSAVGLGSTQYVNQLATSAACAVYAFGGELYYNDASAVPVQITSNGGVVGPTGSWTGLAPPAVAGYANSVGEFYFQKNGSDFGTLRAASLKLQSTLSSPWISLTVTPTTASYQLTLPTTGPLQTGTLLSTNNAGSMSWVTGNSTMTITSSTIGIANGGVGTLQLADTSVTQSKLETRAVGYGPVATTVNVSGPASTVVKQLTGQNYTVGRPVYVCVTGLSQDVSTPNPVSCSVVGSVYLYLLVTKPNGVNTHFSFTPLSPVSLALPNVCGFFNVESTGSHTISLICYIPSSGSSLVISNIAIEAFQL